MSASDVSPSFHLIGRFLFGCWCLVAWVLVLFPVLQVSRDFTIPLRVLDLDDRQGFTARLFSFRAGEESTSLFALDGYHLAALRGTAT